MFSTFSKLKAKVYETVKGKEVVTVDQEFEEKRNLLTGLDTMSKNISTQIHSWLVNVKGMISASNNIALDLKKFYEEPKIDMTDVALEYESVHQALNSQRIEFIEKFLSSNVYPKCDDLQKALETIKMDIKKRDELRLQFDHYTRKVADLNTDRDKTLQKGKQEDPKDVEKRVRNEKKLEDATTQYQDSNKKTKEDIDNLWNTRHKYIDAIFVAFAKTEALFLGAVSEVLQPTVPKIDKAYGQVMDMKIPEVKDSSTQNEGPSIVAAAPAPEVRKPSVPGPPARLPPPMPAGPPPRLPPGPPPSR